MLNAKKQEAKFMSTRIFYFIVMVVLMSCSSKHKEHEHNERDNTEWSGMDSFHMIMADTFHPYMDSSNLQPVKDRAEELKQEAINWANSPLPEKVNNESVKANLLELKAKASALADITKTGSDEEIAASLKELHDLFHKIQESWYAGESSHEHEHH
jgi:hypothetical protein